MFEPISESLSQLSAFVVIGFSLAVFYEVIRIMRLFKKQSDLAVGITDFLFLTAAGVITFAYSMEFGEGRFRLFYIAGEVFGAAVYFLTVGRLISRASNLIVRIIKRIAAFLLKCLKNGIALLKKYILTPIYKKIRVFIQILITKIGNIYSYFVKNAQILINRLKSKVRIVYNRKTTRNTDSGNEKKKIIAGAGEERNVVKGKIRKTSQIRKT